MRCEECNKIFLSAIWGMAYCLKCREKSIIEHNNEAIKELREARQKNILEAQNSQLETLRDLAELKAITCKYQRITSAENERLDRLNRWKIIRNLKYKN